MRKSDKDPAAQSMVAKRWAKTTPEERSEIARRMNEARWGKKKRKKAPQ
jgi:acyl-CoA reductase-like NAD-dependent aldehyde dehydrogenase